VSSRTRSRCLRTGVRDLLFLGGWPQFQFGFELDFDCGCPMFVPHGRTWGFSVLSPAPSSNKMPGEGPPLRGSSRASFRVCASSTIVPLEARLFSYHLSPPAFWQAKNLLFPVLANGRPSSKSSGAHSGDVEGSVAPLEIHSKFGTSLNSILAPAFLFPKTPSACIFSASLGHLPP
jgi:hypothetical protein